MVVKYADLRADQKQQFITLFGECFFKMVDKKAKYTKQLQIVFGDAFLPQFVYAYLVGEKLATLIACSNAQSCATRFSKTKCKAQFGSVLGAVNYRFFKAFFGKPIAKAEDEGYIDYLCVHKDFRRRGIAAQLLNYVYDHTQYNTYLLEVVGNNAAAIALYKKQGYKIAETKKSIMLRLVINDFVYLMKYNKKT